MFTQNGDIPSLHRSARVTNYTDSPECLSLVGRWKGMLYQVQTQSRHSCRPIFLKNTTVVTYFAKASVPNPTAKLLRAFQIHYTVICRQAAYGTSLWRPGFPELEIDKSRGSLEIFYLTLMATECSSKFTSMTPPYHALSGASPFTHQVLARALF